jgi:glycosyltransferase involved in cell wall biosynthesis
MDIGLLIYGNLDTVSGGYLYDRKLVDYLHACGDKVYILSLPWRGYFRHLGDNFSARLLARLVGLEVDVLLQDELNHPSLFWLNSQLRGAVSYPLVSIVHHLRSSELRPTWQNALYRQVERRYLSSLDGLIFNSQTTRAAVQALGVEERPFVVAQPAGDRLDSAISEDDIRFRAVNEPAGPLRLVFLGNVIERKGLHHLLASLAHLPPYIWTLRVIGSLDFEPAYSRRVRQQAQDLGFDDRVTFLGTQDDQLLSDELRFAHLMVVPSSYEGFGIVYLEGMGFGLPAIAGNQGGAGEIITHDKNGFMVDPQNPAELADILTDLHQNRYRLARLGLSARLRYQVHPTWEDSGSAIRSFLLSLKARA